MASTIVIVFSIVTRYKKKKIIDKRPFSINGIEIDLDELDRFEKRLAEKRKLSHLNPNTADGQPNHCNDNGGPQQPSAIDEIDLYLEQLAIDIKAKEDQMDVATVAAASDENCQIVKRDDSQSNESDTIGTASRLPLPVLLYKVLAILCLISSVFKNSKHTHIHVICGIFVWFWGVLQFSGDHEEDEDGDDDEDGEEEEEDDDEDENAVSLADVSGVAAIRRHNRFYILKGFFL